MSVPAAKQRTGTGNKCLKKNLYAERKQISGIVIAPAMKRYDGYGVVICTLKTVRLNEYVRFIKAIPKKEMCPKRAILLLHDE
jgi:hypothetical protein